MLVKAIEKQRMRRSLVILAPYVPDLEFLEGIHRSEYLARFRESVRKGEKVFSTEDCSISSASFDVALLAAGGVMAGVDAVLNGTRLHSGAYVEGALEDKIIFHNDSELALIDLRRRARALGIGG